MSKKIDHAMRCWAVRCTDRKTGRVLWWNGLGWTDEEEFCQLYFNGKAVETASAIEMIPSLQLSFCSEPEVVDLR